MSTPLTQMYKDWKIYDEEIEYLKRFYNLAEQAVKVEYLAEYYKYHNCIPRLFMLPTTDLYNHYQNRKRDFEFRRLVALGGINLRKQERKQEDRMIASDVESLESDLSERDEQDE